MICLRPRLRALLCLVLGTSAQTVAWPAPVAAAPCPLSEVRFNRGPVVTSGVAVFDTSLSADERLAFDLVAGTLLLRHPNFPLLGNSSTHVRARDAFDVVGVAPGTPVSMVAEFSVDGAVWTPACGGSGCWGNLGISIAHGGVSATQNAQINIFTGQPPRLVHLVARLPVVLVAGQPEVLEFLIAGSESAGGNHFVIGDGAYRFLDVPPGVVVVSCQGVAAGPTPTRATSWGRVKAMYR